MSVLVVENGWQTGAAFRSPPLLERYWDFADAHLVFDGLAAVGHRVVHGGPSTSSRN